MTDTKYAPPSVPSGSTITLRRIASFPVIVLLYTAAIPFTPIAWLCGGMEGAYLADQFLAGIALLSALYFQFTVAGLSYPVVISLPNLFSSSGDTYISNGRMGGSRSKNGGASEVLFIYHPANYWLYLALEAGTLAFAAFAYFEYIRRFIILGVVAALWSIGWTITPRSRKDWAWRHIKAIWFFIVLDVIRDIGFGGGRHRRRR